ncbi:hypothetical protein CupriaWKF_25780 [Cupriavidus sp. WKF15]|uniref:hypothetical protein n=1 Tax=Cupriavidus sp. WKF15 TaxID=3032282 RepID=UPI0023E268B0|nr:hypothetical protein [Cupriavidus sp. WKF15]WER48212.1 hypothetical protein CupriaWKF_25780 [Cupriavidus sp. WKF15]
MVTLLVLVAMIVIVIVIVAMMFLGMPVRVPGACFTAQVFVWQRVFRCRASHFFFPAGLT